MLAQRTANDEASVLAYEGAIQPLVDIAMHSDSTDDVCAAERPSFRLKPSEPRLRRTAEAGPIAAITI